MVTGTHSVSFAERQTCYFKRKLGCRKQELAQAETVFCYYNSMIMMVTGTHSVSSAERQIAFKKKIGNWTCHFSGKQLALLMFEKRFSKRIPILTNILKISTCSGKHFQCRGMFWIFGSEKLTLFVGTYSITIYAITIY